MNNKKEKLFTDFPETTTQEWMDKITTDLKGGEFKRLVWKTNEGFIINPFYRKENLEGLKTIDCLPGEFPFVRGTKKDNEWYVRQDIKVKEFDQANKKALDILNKGVDSICFKIEGKDITQENIETLLKNIYPEIIELNFYTCNKKTVDLTKILIKYFKEQKLNLNNCKGSINFDPFKSILKKGVDNQNWIQQTIDIIKSSEELPNYRVVSINATNFNNAGAFIYQELGYAIANGAIILTELTEKGLEPTTIANKIKFNFGIGSNFFIEIAKFRASRWLWAQIVSQYIPNTYVDDYKNAAKIHIHAETSTYNKSIFDAHVNLLRTQTESMSATLGGINSLTIHPFDITYKESDVFSERIARNQQLLLKEECHFGKFSDPTGGSYYIENLTYLIAEEAWKLFLEVDEKGGFYKSLKQGTIQTDIKQTDIKRCKNLATRREILLGTNQFPNFTETASTKIESKSQNCSCSLEKGELETLSPTRLGREFEELRLKIEKSGKTPIVFMLTIGNLAMRLARSQFSCNFFACAGYKVIDNLGFKTVEDGIKAAREKKANIIVICSSDEEYTTLAPQTYELTKGKEIFVVAGAPACTDDLKSIGIVNFINVKSNVLETLQNITKELNI